MVIAQIWGAQKASKFARMLRWTGNSLLKVREYLSAAIFTPPCSQPNFFVNNPGSFQKGGPHLN